jgi:hypothetical protein
LGADTDLDQFTEIVEFVNGIDLENDNALLSSVTSIGLEINDVQDAMESADASLATDLAEAETSLNTQLNNEVDSLETAYTTADTSIVTYLDAEVSSLESADSSLELVLAAARTSIDAAISSEIERATEAEDSLEGYVSTEVSYILDNTDLTKTDSFAEVVTNVNDALDTVNNNALSFVEDNRPSMYGFAQTPNGTNTDFTASVLGGTEIIFLNGLMQLVGEDYTVSTSISGITVSFTNAPAMTDRLNVYGVAAGTSMGTAPTIG